MHKNRPDLLGDGPLILHDSARPHLGKVVTDLLSKYEWQVLPDAPYSPDMSPPDFDLLPKLKQPMRGQRFPPWKSFLQRLPELSELWTKVVSSVE
jgi:transposase